MSDTILSIKDLDSNRINNIAEDAWYGLGDIEKYKFDRKNPLVHRTSNDIENPGLLEVNLMLQPSYLHYATKVLLNVDLLPIQAAILEELWIRSFPMFIASRGGSKSFLLAVYSLLKCLLIPSTKIVVCGAAFRQSKVILEYMETIWKNAPILRDVCDDHSGLRRDVDRWTMYINDSWAIAIPIGTGEKIRGLRAHTIIADEFSSINPEIYEVVISGFTAVSATPVDNVKRASKRKILKETGDWTQIDETKHLAKKGNQAILSGTCSYDFQHFADYWRRYKTIIESKGDKKKLSDIFDENEDIPESFNWKDYSIMRIPYELIPTGFMDDKTILRAKATMHSGTYGREYGSIFSKDSTGFFKRTLIESCVTSDNHPVKINDVEYWFDAVIIGSSGYKYVYGIDPAASVDNFSIIILEVHNDHIRIVYCWTTNMEDFRKRQRSGTTKDHDYYGFCARKVRSLMALFPTENIAIDSQGGGLALAESLHDPDKMEVGEHKLWPVVDSDKKQDTDREAGLHILHMCNFAKADWTADANHNMRKDFQDKILLFPRFDTISLALAADADGRLATKLNVITIYDSLEDCIMEIEELKDELSTIVYSRTGSGVSGREKWDTPEIQIEGRKGRLRKDRYSALTMANMIARQTVRQRPPMTYDVVGGFAHNLPKSQGGKLYEGPDWFTKGVGNADIYGVQIRRK